MSQPAEIDLLAFVGLGVLEDWKFEDDLGVAVDFTGFTAKLEARDDAGTVVLSLTSTGGSPTITFPGGGVVRLAGELDPAVAPGAYVFDLVMAAGAGIADVWVRGSLVVSSPVTVWP